MSFTILSARHVMALSFMSERLAVGKWVILDAACVILPGLFLLEMVNMVKKQGTTQQDGLDYAFDIF